MAIIVLVCAHSVCLCMCARVCVCVFPWHTLVVQVDKEVLPRWQEPGVCQPLSCDLTESSPRGLIFMTHQESYTGGRGSHVQQADGHASRTQACCWPVHAVGMLHTQRPLVCAVFCISNFVWRKVECGVVRAWPGLCRHMRIHACDFRCHAAAAELHPGMAAVRSGNA